MVEVVKGMRVNRNFRRVDVLTIILMQIRTIFRFLQVPVRTAVIMKTNALDLNRRGCGIHCWSECNLV